MDRSGTRPCVKLLIDNWRWADVPFYLRSGKRLARKNSEIAVRFKPIPHRLFGESGDAIDTNALVMKIQPDEGVQIRFNAKVPGPKMHIRAVNMDFNYGTGFGVVSAPAYERLIGDAMRGDATLFTRWDAVQSAWETVMPIIDAWRDTPPQSFPNYEAGDQGPAAADTLLAAEGREWRKLNDRARRWSSTTCEAILLRSGSRAGRQRGGGASENRTSPSIGRDHQPRCVRRRSLTHRDWVDAPRERRLLMKAPVASS